MTDPRNELQAWLDRGGPSCVSQWPEIAASLRHVLATPVTDAMVERGAMALQRLRWTRLKALFETKGASLETDSSGMRDDARACLEAALQPGGGECA